MIPTGLSGFARARTSQLSPCQLIYLATHQEEGTTTRLITRIYGRSPLPPSNGDVKSHWAYRAERAWFDNEGTTNSFSSLCGESESRAVWDPYPSLFLLFDWQLLEIVRATRWAATGGLVFL